MRAIEATVDMACQGSFGTLPNASNYSEVTVTQMQQAVARVFKGRFRRDRSWCTLALARMSARPARCPRDASSLNTSGLQFGGSKSCSDDCISPIYDSLLFLRDWRVRPK